MNKIEDWEFKFPNYVSIYTFKRYNEIYTIKLTIGFISYHLIKWFHGEKKLEEMSARYKSINDLW